MTGAATAELQPGSAYLAGDPESGKPAESRWAPLHGLLAALTLVMLGMRYSLPQGLTGGYVLAFLLVPVWISAVRHYRGARLVLGLGILSILSSVFLTEIAARDHVTSTGKLVQSSVLMLGLLGGVGVILWARRTFSDATVTMWFGAGLLLGVSSDSTLFASNPWRFGFSIAVTVLGLAVAQYLKRRWLELLIVIALAGASAVTDARSSFAILALTVMLFAWQLRPTTSTKRGSAVRVIVVIAALAFVVYNVGQALIIDGFLGEETQQRSVAQIDAAGSLILGGRPEIAATAALMADRPFGFGGGTLPSYHEVGVAKAGMASINYDPDNGYVERYMFGAGIEVHSVIGDVWAHFGIVGVLFCLYVLFLALRGISVRIARRDASAILIFLTIKLVWNMFFAPFITSVPLMMLLLGLILADRGSNRETEKVANFDKLLAGRSA